MRGLVLLCVTVVGCGKGEGTTSGEQGKSPAASVGDHKPVGSIDAGAMWLDFGENQANANSKFKGKVWTVQGQVQSVFESDGGYAVGFVVYLDEDPSHPAGTIAKFPASRQKSIAALNKMDRAEVTGVCLGRSPGQRKGYAIILDDCTLGPVKKWRDQ